MPNYGYDEGQGHRGEGSRSSGRERDEYGRFRSDDDDRGDRGEHHGGDRYGHERHGSDRYGWR